MIDLQRKGDICIVNILAIGGFLYGALGVRYLILDGDGGSFDIGGLQDIGRRIDGLIHQVIADQQIVKRVGDCPLAAIEEILCPRRLINADGVLKGLVESVVVAAFSSAATDKMSVIVIPELPQSRLRRRKGQAVIQRIEKAVVLSPQRFYRIRRVFIVACLFQQCPHRLDAPLFRGCGTLCCYGAPVAVFRNGPDMLLHIRVGARVNIIVGVFQVLHLIVVAGASGRGQIGAVYIVRYIAAPLILADQLELMRGIIGTAPAAEIDTHHAGTADAVADILQPPFTGSAAAGHRGPVIAKVPDIQFGIRRSGTVREKRPIRCDQDRYDPAVAFPRFYVAHFRPNHAGAVLYLYFFSGNGYAARIGRDCLGSHPIGGHGRNSGLGR